MALRSAPKRNSINYEEVDKLQKEIFGSNINNSETNLPATVRENESKENASKTATTIKEPVRQIAERRPDSALAPAKSSRRITANQSSQENLDESRIEVALGEHLSDLETIAAGIVASKAGQGRNTTRPFSLPRTLIIDTTRLKSKFRTIDEQFTQNVIIDFLLREALAAATPQNYKELKKRAFEFVKRPDETTRRSLTVTEEVVYQMSELKAGINLESGKKYSNDEIFSTLLALGVSWLYRNNVLS